MPLIPKRKYWTNHAALNATGGGFSPSSTESSNFLARTTGLNNTQKGNYDTLITGLVGDGVFSKFDALWIMAAPDATNAVLNLVSSSFALVAHGSPTFTADRGYTGTNASTTVYLDTQFNPTSGSPKYTQNDAHAGCWSNNNTASGSAAMGLVNSGAGIHACMPWIFPRFTPGDISGYYVNDQNGLNSSTPANSDGSGHYIGVRSGASTQEGYRNKIAQTITPATNTVAPESGTVYLLNTFDINGSVGFGGWAGQMSCAHLGSKLTLTNAQNLYDRLRTFMTAVGVP